MKNLHKNTVKMLMVVFALLMLMGSDCDSGYGSFYEDIGGYFYDDDYYDDYYDDYDDYYDDDYYDDYYYDDAYYYDPCYCW
ncbi:MAG: hypothetical protein ACYTF1_15315 [Planctomycetota bacterium]|jgi:hypothetical protein